MARDPKAEEAFRTAVGMARAVHRRDIEGLRELWYGSEEPDRVAHWLAALAATTAIAAAHGTEKSPDEWLAAQIDAYERAQGE